MNAFKEGKCHICNGDIERFMDKLEESLSSVSFPNAGGIEGARWFSLSTHIPKAYLAREEDAFDYTIGESLKAQLNGEIRRIIERKTSLKYDVDKADVRFIIEFPYGSIKAEAEDYFAFGFYRKLKPYISQKRWYKYERSVEGIVGEKLNEVLRGEEYYMHASGREDADAINEGERPFVMEIKKAKRRMNSEELRNVEIKGDVEAWFVGRVRRSFVSIVSDSHFDKSYRAYVEWKEMDEEAFFRKLKDACKSIEGTTLRQRTPTRVIRRRVDKIRKRKVYSCKVGRDERGIYIDVKAEAGTYIKELISGDNGRTKPSVAEMVGKPVVCTFLIVKHINYAFLNTVIGHALI